MGRVQRPHGVRGEVLVIADSEVPGRFVVGARFHAHGACLKEHGARLHAPGARLEALPSEPALGAEPPASTRELEVASIRRHGGRWLIRFAGCDDRTAAERLRGLVLVVPVAQAPAPPDGHYYYHQLIGCRCFDPQRGELGVVRAVVEGGGGHLLEIEHAGRRLLVPFVRAYVRRVDPRAARVELALPAGLIEACAST